MKNIIYILTIGIIMSCNQSHSTKKNLKLSSTDNEITKPQSGNSTDDLANNELREISPDYFIISQKEFEEFKVDNSKWFINNARTEKLYFVPYTDYSITTAILTNKELGIKEVELLKTEGIRTSDLEKAIEIRNIKSKKGITLGLTTKQVIEIIGQSNEIRTENKKKLLKWHFIMKENNSKGQVGGLKPFFYNGLEFTAEMEFLDDKLVQVKYRYEVP